MCHCLFIRDERFSTGVTVVWTINGLTEKVYEHPNKNYNEAIHYACLTFGFKGKVYPTDGNRTYILIPVSAEPLLVVPNK